MLTLARALALLALVLAAPAWGQGAGGAAFDPARLDRAELRFVQAALAFEGRYDGLLDGAWGRGSQAALEDWAGPRGATWDAVARLARGLEVERRRGDWAQVWHAGERVGHLMPYALLELRSDADGLAYASLDGGLRLTYRIDSRPPDDLHAALVAEGRGRDAPYRLRQDDLVVSAGRAEGGMRSYVRSDRVDGGRWATHAVLADDANAGRLQLVASSFANRQAAALAVPEDGTLAALIADDGRAVAPDRGQPAPRAGAGGAATSLEAVLGTLLDRAIEDALGRDGPDPETPPRGFPDDGPAGFGDGATAFRVNTTDLVMATRALDRCAGAVETDAGDALREVAFAPALGLSVVAGRGRSAAWLSLAERATPAGATVTLAAGGGPDGDLEGRLREAADGRWVEHSAAHPPRLDGAPILDRDGRVVAVAMARGRGEGGRAVTATALAAFLDDEGVPYHDRAAARVDPVPEGAVIHVRCAGRRPGR